MTSPAGGRDGRRTDESHERERDKKSNILITKRQKIDKGSIVDDLAKISLSPPLLLPPIHILFWINANMSSFFLTSLNYEPN